MPNPISRALAKLHSKSHADDAQLLQQYDDNLKWLYGQLAEQLRLTTQIDQLSEGSDLWVELRAKRDELMRTPAPDSRWSKDPQEVERLRLKVVRRIRGAQALQPTP